MADDNTVDISEIMVKQMNDRLAREKEVIENPPHYAQYKIEPIDFIIANELDYCTGNIIKYILRRNLKNGVEDLKKAKQYIEFLIKAEEVKK